MNYPALLREILDRIQQGQVRAALSVNVELLSLYWDVGRIIATRQNDEGWGAAVIPRLAHDIKNNLVDIKGFSERNLRRMVSFYREYKGLLIWPTALAELADRSEKEVNEDLHKFVLQLPWAQNVALLAVKIREERLWYMMQAISKGWSHDTLCEQIKTNLFARQGKPYPILTCACRNHNPVLPKKHSKILMCLISSRLIPHSMRKNLRMPSLAMWKNSSLSWGLALLS